MFLKLDLKDFNSSCCFLLAALPIDSSIFDILKVNWSLFLNNSLDSSSFSVSIFLIESILVSKFNNSFSTLSKLCLCLNSINCFETEAFSFFREFNLFEISAFSFIKSFDFESDSTILLFNCFFLSSILFISLVIDSVLVSDFRINSFIFPMSEVRASDRPLDSILSVNLFNSSFLFSISFLIDSIPSFILSMSLLFFRILDSISLNLSSLFLI